MRWDTFLIKEALQIKEKNPPLNNGLKASKEFMTALIYYKLIDSTNYFCMSFNFYCNTFVNSKLFQDFKTCCFFAVMIA